MGGTDQNFILAFAHLRVCPLARVSADVQLRKRFPGQLILDTATPLDIDTRTFTNVSMVTPRPAPFARYTVLGGVRDAVSEVSTASVEKTLAAIARTVCDVAEAQVLTPNMPFTEYCWTSVNAMYM